MGVQHLGTAWNGLRSLGERLRDFAVFGCRTLDDRNATDSQTHMRIGILGLQKTGVECAQMLHAVTMRCVLPAAAGPQVLNRRAQRRWGLAAQLQDRPQRPSGSHGRWIYL